MKAAVFHAAHDLRVQEVPEPGAVGPTGVRLRPIVCGICGTDLHEFAAGPIVTPAQPHPLNGSVLPQVMGHEFSAEVLETGPEVTSVRAGDRVVVMPLVTCGRCYFCRRGLNHLCVVMACVGLSYDGGGLAEQIVVPEHLVTRLPDEVSDVQGALVEPAAVAAYGVDRAGTVPGDTVLVTGAGPIGALAALYAAASGAARVIVSEPNPRRRALAEAFGVAEVVDPAAVDLTDFVRERTEGLGADVAVECSGSEPGLRSALAAVRAAGTVAQTGLHTRPASIDPMDLSNRDLTLVGTWCYPVNDFGRVLRLIAGGTFPVEKVLSDVVTIDDVVSQGFERLLDPASDAQKVLVRVP
ncbi:2,3-butanediol dehydrogenase [Kineococcus rhizosphaerae]|uniref:(R,R)-butanediol dehydrogenase/meso-butanediol dehydrogenase/diacetyl reductase n=1 Tax=Kineococcus rhizosphaerae TaxID=559628 RepID=A0A2T0QXB1_9ACTN|nr:2,3-butanediol dehydrogenase [Kineococcus rhizosphaerae]PRY10516.1 (R,R)-butanediol dehydrogenase/meso-butanediol dehydrogenase/diacetyl reductase [Kineococcus rhizosphaerae]